MKRDDEAARTGAHHPRAAFSNRGHLSARRKDAVLTAVYAVVHCAFLGGKS